MAGIGPVGTAYQALHGRIEAALRAGDILGPDDRLQLDPESPFEPNGDERELISSAAMLKVQTRPNRAEMGGPNGAVWAVECDVRVELACAGPQRLRQARLQTFEHGLAAMAAAVTDDATLGGAAERCWLVGREDGDLPPNGSLAVLGVTFRVRSGDMLGLTYPR
ncbi:hypothetical protein [Brevundimonas sp.]|uniref:hypothetical protein n=1 Tax=Brevundimonas sp. TaxID=1871086 RepID=UPI002D5B8096|nr:hypothetical protein [Brevundimonas sp.]HYD26972.1 hypothetical protein [Brevundimonas sp.]